MYLKECKEKQEKVNHWLFKCIIFVMFLINKVYK